MRQLAFLLLLLLAMTPSYATTVTISAQHVPNFRAPNIGVERTGTCGVTNGGVTVTFATALSSNLRGQSGFLINLAGTIYYVDRVADSGTSLTITANYTGSTSASAAYTIYPMVALRIYADRSFTPLGATYTVQQGGVDSQNWHKQVLCSYYLGSVWVPQFTLDATSDIPTPAQQGARYYPIFYRVEGGRISPYGSLENGMVVPASPATTTWANLIIASNPAIARRPDLSTLSTEQIMALLNNVGGVTQVTAAELVGTSSATVGQEYFQTDGVRGFYRNYGGGVGIRRINSCVSPYDIGIVPNSSGSASANQTAWQAFHDAAPAAGSCIQFPEGTFYFTTGFTNTKPMQILGVGKNFTNQAGTYAGTTIVVNSGQSGIIFNGISTAKGGRVENMNIKTASGISGQTTGDGIWADTIITVRNVSIEGFGRDGIRLLGSSGQISDFSRFDTIDIFDVGEDGLHLDGGGDTNVIHTQMVNVTRAGRHGIYDKGFTNIHANTHVAYSGRVNRVSATTSGGITGSSGSTQTVTLSNVTNIGVGSLLLVDSGGSQETAVVTAMPGGSQVTGWFTKNHSSGVAVVDAPKDYYIDGEVTLMMPYSESGAETYPYIYLGTNASYCFLDIGNFGAPSMQFSPASGFAGHIIKKADRKSVV